MTSKFSPTLKAALTRCGDPLPGPSRQQLVPLFKAYDKQVISHGLAQKHWLTLATATFFTMNSPTSLTHLWHYLREESSDVKLKVEQANLMREVGLKCIGLIGVPRIINQLGSLTAQFDNETKANLPQKPTRALTADKIKELSSRGFGLWKSIYANVAEQLYDKLGKSHPDLPVYILEAEYGQLFSDPSEEHPVDRVLTSLMAIACLRSQEGVGPQVISHVLGLKRAPKAEWLGTDEGAQWAISVVEQLSDLVKSSQQHVRAKL